MFFLWLHPSAIMVSFQNLFWCRITKKPGGMVTAGLHCLVFFTLLQLFPSLQAGIVPGPKYCRMPDYHGLRRFDRFPVTLKKRPIVLVLMKIWASAGRTGVRD
jgi:hypothetical protein